MIHYLLSENLKFKRTFSRKLIVAVPLFFSSIFIFHTTEPANGRPLFYGNGI